MSTSSGASTPSTPPRPAAARTTIPPRRRQAQRLERLERRDDSFDDARPEQRSARRESTVPRRLPAEALLIAGHGVSAGLVVGLHEAAVVGSLALAVVGGATLTSRLPAVTAAGALLAASGVVLAGGGTVPAMIGGLVAGAAVAGFSLLPRVVTRAAIAAARRSERERADSEILRLIDDARRLRALGGRPDGDVDATTRDVAGAVAQRDRLYRLLGLVERALDGVSCVALYGLEPSGQVLRLIEQRHTSAGIGGGDVDDAEASNHDRLDLGKRGVGPAGVAGLAVQRKTPLRVTDDEGGAVAAHRKAGSKPRSVMCVPLLGPREVVTGVIVVDRVAAVAFSAADEAFVRAAAAEVVDGLAMEALIDDLDAERRRVARVFAAARALAGASRRSDVDRLTLAAVKELVAGAAIVDVTTAEDHSQRFVVAAADGLLEGLAGARGELDATSFSARALVEGVPLPHVSLDKATARPILSVTDAVALTSLGDVRAIPLAVAGDAAGVLLIAVRPGERLRGAIVDALVAMADVAALALASARTFDAVERKATTDGLTGVWNRRTLDEKLAEAVARARRSGQPLCVIMTDVDHFKSVNDTWGHATGDEVLKGVAKALQLGARTTDVVGRLGGEEFVVVCEGTDLDGAGIVAERMRVALKQLQFETPKGPLSITSSFGVARLLTDDVDGHATLEASDKNLYKAKQAGRDRVVAI